MIGFSSSANQTLLLNSQCRMLFRLFNPDINSSFLEKKEKKKVFLSVGSVFNLIASFCFKLKFQRQFSHKKQKIN